MNPSKPTTSAARAAASRRNGARSKGPRTAAGKARSARNALKHGLAPERMIPLADEDGAELQAFAQSLRAELHPVGALQKGLVDRIAVATWRARRADRLEAALSGRHLVSGDDPEVALGNGLIRDGHGPRRPLGALSGLGAGRAASLAGGAEGAPGAGGIHDRWAPRHAAGDHLHDGTNPRHSALTRTWPFRP